LIKRYTKQQHQTLREGGKILARCLDVVKESVKEGVSTLELDKIAREFIKSKGAVPSFRGYQGYRYSICVSINNESIHGVPSDNKVLKDGDIVSIDIGVRHNGLCTDAARTFAVGNVSAEAQQLIDASRESFYQGILGLKAGERVGSIGERIEDYIKKNTDYSIIESYCGHGVGKKIHEDPLVPNFRPSVGKLAGYVDQTLPDGCVLAIEPMINQGVKDIKLAEDGWTVLTADGKLAAHWENTVIVTKDGVEIITV